jgi:hypothetical protein
MGEMRNTYRNVIRKPEGKRPFSRLFVDVYITIEIE